MNNQASRGSWSHIYPTLHRPHTLPSSVLRRSRCGRWEAPPGCFDWGRSERLSHSQTADKEEDNSSFSQKSLFKDRIIDRCRTRTFLNMKQAYNQDFRIETKKKWKQNLLLTTKTNVPRNSARNSLNIPCLSAQCCLMLLSCCVSVCVTVLLKLPDIQQCEPLEFRAPVSNLHL